jgi:hypothetical protein
MLLNFTPNSTELLVLYGLANGFSAGAAERKMHWTNGVGGAQHKYDNEPENWFEYAVRRVKQEKPGDIMNLNEAYTVLVRLDFIEKDPRNWSTKISESGRQILNEPQLQRQIEEWQLLCMTRDIT